MDVTTWFKSYLSHPIGKGADLQDYFLTIILVGVLIWVVIKLKNNLA